MRIEKLRKLENKYEPMKPSFASKKAIYDYAEKMANKNLKTGDDLYELVKANGGKIHYIDFCKFNDSDGSIYVHSRDNFDIILPSHTGPFSDRFTIAHEIAHFLLHQPDIKSWASRRGDERIELEANWFATGFLMPQKEFQKAIDEGMCISRLATYFGVSPTVAEIKYKQIESG